MTWYVAALAVMAVAESQATAWLTIAQFHWQATIMGPVCAIDTYIDNQY